MSPRKPAALRDGDGQNLRDHLIATAARLIGERGTAGLGVRDIAREAKVADGVLYNYFAAKEDLLAEALLVHVGSVMGGLPGLPPPGTGSLAANLARFIDTGLAALGRVVPAFAGLQSQPKVLQRFHDLVGGQAAFGAAVAGGDDPCPEGPHPESPRPEGPHSEGPHPEGPGDTRDGDTRGGTPQYGLPAMLSSYLLAEQRLGRVAAGADIEAAVILVVGAIHGQILPTALLRPGSGPATVPPGLAQRLAATVLTGIAPAPASA